MLDLTQTITELLENEICLMKAFIIHFFVEICAPAYISNSSLIWVWFKQNEILKFRVSTGPHVNTSSGY